MLGLQLFIHSVKLVVLNFRQALHLSIPMIVPWCIGFAILQFGGSIDAISSRIFGNFFALGAAFALTLSIGLIWTAVGWHRFILLEESQNSALPRFQPKVFHYAWRSLLLGLSIGLILAFATTITGSIGFSIGGIWISAILLFIVGALLNWTFYLLSPILPAAALGQKMTFADAWEQTEDYAGSIAIVALCYFGLGYALESVTDVVGTQLPKFAYFGLSSLVSWLLAMLGISLLTTIYGVAVENRDL